MLFHDKLRNNKHVHQLLRYILVGGSAFVTEYLLFILLMHALTVNGKLTYAQTLSFMGGLVVSFMGNRSITFSHHDAEYKHTRMNQFSKYVVLALINLLVTNVLIYVLVNSAGILPFVAKIEVMVAVACWNFVIFKKLIFITN